MSIPVEFTRLSIDVPNVGTVVFNSVDEGRAWINYERDFIAPALHASLDGHAYHGLRELLTRYERLANPLNQAANTIHQATNVSQENRGTRENMRQTLQNQLDEFSHLLRQAYDGPNALWHSGSPEAKFIHDLGAKKPNEAAYALLQLRGARFDMVDAASRSGAFLAEAYRNGIGTARVDAESGAIADLRKGWIAESGKMVTDFEHLRSSVSNLIAQQGVAVTDAKGALQSQITAFQEFVDAKDSEFLMQREKAGEELQKIAKTYDEFMKLKAPVDYWRAKKEHHQTARNWLIFLTVVVGTVAFYSLWKHVEENFHTANKDQIPWRDIVGFVVLSSGVFWTVRILVRLLLSSIHLVEDAGEREVMAMTYMAMVRGDETKTKYLDEKDRALVLAALFRPASTGVVSDDGAPPHLAEFLTKIRGR